MAVGTPANETHPAFPRVGEAAPVQSSAGLTSSLIGVLSLIITTFTVIGTVVDQDLWGHLRFGLDLLHSRQLPTVDLYSFTQDVPWINHEWLSELLLALAYSAGGIDGLLILKVCLTTAVFFVVMSSLAGVSPTAKWSVLALAALGALSLMRTARPHLWTLLALAILCRMLASRRRLAFMPLLFAVWANLHGGWIVGLGVLGLWTLVASVLEGAGKHRQTWLVLVACLLATLLTPYGWHMWRFLATTVRTAREITEWQPLWREVSTFWAVYLVTIGLAATLFRHQKQAWADVAVVAMLALAGLKVGRLAPLFVVSTLVLLGPFIRERWPATEQDNLGTRASIALGALVVSMASWAFLQTVPAMRCIAMIGEWLPDSQPVAALQHAGARGRLITWFDWGEYAIWHLGPDLKVSIDGRRETIYSDAVIREQLALGIGQASAFGALARLDPEYVWLSTRYAAATKTWLAGHGYRIDLETDRSFVAVRGDLPRVLPVEVETARCFPGP